MVFTMSSLMSPHLLPEATSTDSRWKIHVYAHTHWDREWYQPFERFRMQLVAAVDLILETLETRPDFPTFVLDGQTIVIDDYLAVRPEREAQLRDMIARGRLEVGPWYILPDEFLVSGESFVRNLLEGRRRAEQLGRRTDVGYLPDPFGHVAQLPQILQGFGIDSMIFSRGMGDEFARLGNEFRWVAADGVSSVLALVQTATYTNGYCNAEVLSKAHDGGGVPLHVEPAVLGPELADKLAAQAKSNVLLFAAGCDHETVNPWLPDRVSELSAQFENADASIGGLAAYVRDVRDSLEARGGVASLAQHQGELRGAIHAPILAAIFSARIPLKQDNVHVQTTLERVVEPIVAFGSALGIRRADVGMLNHAWRIALQNQPHDSIGGCSVDATHLDMPPRTRAVLQVADGMIEDIAIAAGLVDDVLVFNPHPERVSGIVESATSGTRVVEMVPGMSLVRWSELPPVNDPAATVVNDRSVRSDRFEVGVSDQGDVWIRDTVSGASTTNALQFVDVGDVGDEYDFSPGRGEVHAALRSVHAGSRAPGSAHLDLVHELDIPRSADDAERVSIQIRTRLEVVDGQQWVACTSTFNNQACDHRLRVRVALGAHAVRSFGDGHFAWVERPVRPESPQSTWAQQPVPSQYCEAGAALEGESGAGIATFSHGLHEYEGVHGADGTSYLELTLVRAVGWLSRDTIEGRPGHAGPGLPTPDAQCIGDHTVVYGIAPYAPADAQQIAHRARVFAAPLRVIEPIEPEFRNHSGQQARERDLAAARLCDSSQLSDIAARLARGMLTVDGGVELSACKPAADGSGDIIVRVFHPGSADATASVWFGVQFTSVAAARLDETRDDAWSVATQQQDDGVRFEFPVPAGAIRTIRITPAAS